MQLGATVNTKHNLYRITNVWSVKLIIALHHLWKSFVLAQNYINKNTCKYVYFGRLSHTHPNLGIKPIINEPIYTPNTRRVLTTLDMSLIKEPPPNTRRVRTTLNIKSLINEPPPNTRRVRTSFDIKSLINEPPLNRRRVRTTLDWSSLAPTSCVKIFRAAEGWEARTHTGPIQGIFSLIFVKIRWTLTHRQVLPK